MHNVGVAILHEHLEMPKQIPLVCEGRWGPSSPLVVEFFKLLWTCSVTVTGGNVLHLKKELVIIDVIK